MRASSRSGFTLVELLIAIVVFGIVSASLFTLLVRTQRASRTQADRATMQANVRAGVALVTSELRELNINATQSDIASAGATAIRYRGMRGLGFICDHSTSMIRIRRGNWLASYREPVATDSLMVYVDNDVDITTDDAWTRRGISAVANATCSSDGAAAIELTLGSVLSADTVAMIQTGSPIRTFEHMEIGALVQGGETWLAARSMSAGQAFQPVLGPLNAGGVAFQYLNAAGTAGATELTTRTIVLTLTGITENPLAAGTGLNAGQRATEQLVTRIRLRNAP